MIEKKFQRTNFSLKAYKYGGIDSISNEKSDDLVTLKVEVPADQADQALALIQGLDQTPMYDAHDIYSTMNHQELLNELDLRTRRFNDLERNRDFYKRWTNIFEEELIPSVKNIMSHLSSTSKKASSFAEALDSLIKKYEEA